MDVATETKTSATLVPVSAPTSTFHLTVVLANIATSIPYRRARVPLMNAEALSVCGEELGELRHYGAGLRGTAVAPTGCMLLRL